MLNIIRIPALKDNYIWLLTQGRQARERSSVLGMASSNQEFHRALVDAAGSARLSSAMESVLAEIPVEGVISIIR